jgi:hypothetical protein
MMNEGQHMDDASDLQPILNEWPYDPDDNVRVGQLSDGREVLQVRLPLGIEQYELEGRPDGCRPHGEESALDYQLARREGARAKGGEQAFRLSRQDCAELFEEGVLYYYRYFHLFQIQDWPRTIRDTARNIVLFDFVQEHAERAEDREYLEPWRPYILRVNAVALAMLHIERNDYADALAVVRDAVQRIESLPERENSTFQFELQRSLTTLTEMTDQLKKNKPLSELELLERELCKAVKEEEYEYAAELRDRIERMRSR